MTDASDPGMPANVIQHNVSPRSFARNVLFGYVATASSVLSGFVVTPVLYRQLGVARFAAFGLISAITGFALLADLGVGTACIRRIARAVAQDDAEALWTTVRASRYLLAGSGTLSLAALLTVVWQMPQIFDLSGVDAGTVRWGLAITAVGISVSIGLSTPTMVIVGHGRSDLLSKRTVAIGLLTATAECVVALAGGGLIGLCIVVSVGSIATASANLVLMRRVVTKGRPPHPTANRAEIRDVLSEGLTNFVISVAGTIAFTSDTIVLGAVAPLSAIAAYVLAAKLPGLIRLTTSRAIDLLQPTYSHLHARAEDEPHAAFLVLSRATRYSTGLALAAGLGAATSAGWLLHTWVGHVPPKAVLTLNLLLAGTVLQMFGHAVYVYLTGIRHLRRLLVFSIISAGTNLSLSIVFSIRIGAPGPALASLICVALGDLIVLPAISASALGVRPGKLLGEMLLRPLLPLVPAVAFALGIGVSTSSAWSLLIAGATVLIYLIGYSALLTSQDRVLVGSARSRWRRRSRAAIAERSSPYRP